MEKKKFIKKSVGESAAPALINMIIGGAGLGLAAVVTNELMPKIQGGIGAKTELHPIAPILVGGVLTFVGEMAENDYITVGGAAMAGYGILETVNRNVLKEKAIKLSALGNLPAHQLGRSYYMPKPETTVAPAIGMLQLSAGEYVDTPDFDEAEILEITNVLNNQATPAANLKGF